MIRAVLGACHLNWWHTSVNEYMVILDVRNWITNFPGVYIDMIHSKTFIAIVEVTCFLSSAEALLLLQRSVYLSSREFDGSMTTVFKMKFIKLHLPERK